MAAVTTAPTVSTLTSTGLSLSTVFFCFILFLPESTSEKRWGAEALRSQALLTSRESLGTRLGRVRREAGYK